MTAWNKPMTEKWAEESIHKTRLKKDDRKERTYDLDGVVPFGPTSQVVPILHIGWAMAQPYKQLKIKQQEL